MNRATTLALMVAVGVAAGCNGSSSGGSSGSTTGGSNNTNSNPVIASPATGTALPGGTGGTAYLQSITIVSGGQAPYLVAAKALPPGLSYLSNPGGGYGVLTGVPTLASSAGVQLTFLDAVGSTTQLSYPLSVTSSVTSSVTDAIVLSPASGTTLPNATFGASYTQTFTVKSGGTAPYTITATPLPGGLALTSGGSGTATISGVTTQACSCTFQLEVTDATGAVTEALYVLNVNPTLSLQKVTLSPASGSTLPNATSGQSYSQAFTIVNGGNAPYQVIPAFLPPGLSYQGGAPGQTSGTLQGVPTQGGSGSSQLQVIDSTGTVTVATYNITVLGAGGGLSLTPTSAPSAKHGTPYSFNFSVVGGTGPYTFLITSGSLPAGLQLGPASSGVSGQALISGTPTTAGTSSVTISVTDSSSPVLSGAQSFTITVN